MVRILGVYLPRNRRVDVGLTSIFGLGSASAVRVVKEADVPPTKRCKDLTDAEVSRIRVVIGDNYQTEGDLRRFCTQNIKRLKDIGSAKGRRHRVGLPVRGQRTRTNARTRKGNRKN
jgi:small subunit ribosomal protein S13